MKYIYSFIYEKRQFDFLLTEYNLVIEVNGDYWHANPKYWDTENNDNNKKKLYETQKMKIIDDIIKKDLIDKSKYNLLVLWEDDINNNYEFIDKIIKEKIKEKYD